MFRDTYALIHLENIEHNVRQMKQLAPDQELMAVVKADAYGHGAVPVARAALRAGADRLAVATPDEALFLRANGIDAPLLILGICEQEAYYMLISNDVAFCVASIDALEPIAVAAKKLVRQPRLHLKLDTGMGRIGVRSMDELDCFLVELKRLELPLEGVFTHFCTADCADRSFTSEQLLHFKAFCERIEQAGYSPLRHCANSAAGAELPETRMDMVREGILLYGSYPSHEVDRSVFEAREVMELKTRIVALKTISTGESVSYGRRYIAEGERRIATIPVGYADGYNRALTNKADALVRGQRARIAGTICMDQIMLDVTDIADVSVGDEVVLLGRQGRECISAEELADLAGTISYEIYTSVTARVPRVYTGLSNKRDIRKNALLMRGALSSAERKLYSAEIARRIIALECFREAKSIMCYYPIRSEVDTELITTMALMLGKRVYMPKIEGEGKDAVMRPAPYTEETTTAAMGTREPLSDAEPDAPIELVIAPCVAFDESCARIGYGGGFYDRFLSQGSLAVAVAFECQKSLDAIPAEETDIRPSVVVTEKRYYE